MVDPRWSLHFAWGRTPYALDLPEVVVGRGDACTLQIQDAEAADEHARFDIDDEEQVWLEDLGTGKTTLVNGKGISGRTRLGDGDFIQIGHAVLTLRMSAPSEAPAHDPANDPGIPSGQHASMQTIMMEAPVLPKRPREPQQTLQVDSADVLASIRRDPPPPEAPPPPQTSGPAAATVTMPTAEGPVEHATLMMSTVPGDEGVPSESLPAVMVTLPGIGPNNEIAAAATMIGEMPKPTPAPTDIPSATTVIAEMPPPPQRPRSQSMADITPLPAPLPPPMSIPDLRQFVDQATGGVPQGEGFGGEPTRAQKGQNLRSNVETLPPGATLNSMSTQQLSSMPDDQQGIGYEKTSLPQQVPPEVQALHAQSTQIGTPLPAAAIAAANAAPAVDNQTQRPMPAYQGAYVPPAKGMFGSFSRAGDFIQQMFALAKAEPAIKKPIFTNIAIATPVMLVLSALTLVMRSGGAVYTVMSVGVTLLYFIDYYSNAMTASLMYDYVTTGRADLPAAKARVKKSLSGIMMFAAVSALLDVASTYARERRDVLSKIILKILYAIWTTATYVILPAMVIEGVPFKDAFARSKKLMAHDPTGVGSGVVALSLVSYFIGAIVFPLAYTLLRLGSHLHAIVGLVLFFAMVNVYWAVTGWLKIAYSTCFYMWAKQCEATGQQDAALAPLPLRHAMDAG